MATINVMSMVARKCNILKTLTKLSAVYKNVYIADIILVYKSGTVSLHSKIWVLHKSITKKRKNLYTDIIFIDFNEV